jgi:OmpA-OmpF porin, OOP family
MKATQSLIAVAAFLIAALLSYFGAVWAVTRIEVTTTQAVSHKLSVEGLDWAKVAADGLQVKIAGTAPNEAARFRALTFAGSVVDAARVHDLVQVMPAKAIAPPHFSVELLRNDDGISLIGLVPASTGHDAIAAKIAALATPGKVTDLLETATDPAPKGWDTALAFGLTALDKLPHSKISISAEKVTVTAIADSPVEKRNYETELARAAPAGLTVGIEISAPRPVITPFTLRFVIDESGPRFDACSADTTKARDTIVSAAVAAGVTGKVNCTIGLGVPSPSWAEAAALGIAAVKQMGKGSVTFSDADVTLLATADTPQAVFDRVVGDLGAKLPDVFSLDATLPEKAKTAAPDGPVEFTATLDAKGHVDLRGRLTDDRMHDAVDSFARAKFGAENVFTATRTDEKLPDGWPERVLAGLDSLSLLHTGTLLVQPDMVVVTGVAGAQDAQDHISRILSDKLGKGQAFSIKVTYDKRFDPLASLPTPAECIAEIKAAIAAKKISFDPGKDTIAPGSAPTIDRIAAEVKKCPTVAMEIGGYTDSQGSPEMNLALSQARANAVLSALSTRRVDTGKLTAKGYGETNPIADNGTDAGREANRRIEFKLNVAAAPEVATPDTAAPDTAQPDAANPDAVAPDTVTDGSGDTSVDNSATDGISADPPPDATAATSNGAVIGDGPAAPSAPTIRPKARP